MKNQIIRSSVKCVAAGIIIFAATLLPVNASVPGQTQKPLDERVRHEIAMQPYYTVFDNVQYAVVNDTVTLSGQVTRPVLKSDIENAVKRIAGVAKVVNNLEVLPLSSFDDSIRIAEYRAIYRGDGPLSGYGWGAVPSIHIIVSGGRVTLTGTVHREVDKNMATLLAKGVNNVFAVENNLIVK